MRIRRHSPGVVSSSFLDARMKHAWSAKPDLSAISAMELGMQKKLFGGIDALLQ